MKKINKTDPFFDREAKKYKDPIPSREFILKHLEKSRLPKRYNELTKALLLRSRKSSEALKWRLNAMVRDGQLLVDRKGRYVLAKQLDLLSGHVICHKDGYGFFVPDDGKDDIFLNPRQMQPLFPGDRVLVTVISTNKQGKREGAVVEILERNLKQVVGRYFVKKGVGFIVSTNKNIVQEVIIPRGKDGGAKVGQFVVAKIINYPTVRSNATGQIVKILGVNVNSSLEVEIAANAYGLPYIWPSEVLQECQSFMIYKGASKNHRRQLQDLPFVTIDGEDAKDFDDAVYCKCHVKDGWILYVAIADVGEYVGIRTPMDQEALRRGNSVYFPEQVIPMLPEVLSNDLCSLKPNAERLVLVCEIHINNDGKIIHYEFYEGVIKSHARFTYDEVFDALEDKNRKSFSLLPEIKVLRNLYHALLKQRKIRGALDFSRIESKIIFDDKQKIKNIIPIEHHYVHGMIEECMLAANVCASKFLLKWKIPALYRVHEGPDEEKLYNLRLFLKSLGLELKGGNKPLSIHYAELLKKLEGRRDEHLVETVLLRSMRQAVYTSENIGHFGLAYEAYVHFTSPIRRYPDLINHRAIKYLLNDKKIGDYPYTKSQTQSFGNHCSLTERRAADAERDVVMWHKCEFMRDKVGKTFSGIISGVMNFGIFVELKDIFVEGLVHITSLKNDYYRFDPLHQKLVGKRSGKIYRLGDLIRVVVAKVDLDEREIGFDLIA